MQNTDRRDFLKLAGIAGVTFTAGLFPGRHAAAQAGDNVSDPGAKLGDEQLAWLAADLKQRKPDDRIVVLTHRPLFDLKPDWDWTTADGAKAMDLLMPYQNVVVFYGHIHQENHHMTGHIAHHAAKSLIFPQPAPGDAPKRPPPPPFDASLAPLGTRDVSMGSKVVLTELPVTRA